MLLLLLLLVVRPDVVAVGTGTMVARHGDGGLRVALWRDLRQQHASAINRAAASWWPPIIWREQLHFPARTEPNIPSSFLHAIHPTISSDPGPETFLPRSLGCAWSSPRERNITAAFYLGDGCGSPDVAVQLDYYMSLQFAGIA
jgi:hypothetical protein